MHLSDRWVYLPPRTRNTMTRKSLAFATSTTAHLLCRYSSPMCRNRYQQKILSHINVALSVLKSNFPLKDTHPTTPNDLFKRGVIGFLPPPPPWSINLVTLFFHALPYDLYTTVQLRESKLPNLSNFTPINLQK